MKKIVTELAIAIFSTDGPPDGQKHMGDQRGST